MKNRVYLAAALSLMLASVSASAQVSGLLFSRSDMTHTDLFKLSATGTQFGTARSVAMGSAFTSLGGDLASMHINPAGLGMYRSSEFGITPMVTFNKVNSRQSTGGLYNGSNSKTNFALANVGAAINIYEGAGTLTSFTFGMAFNRLADHNSNNFMDLGRNPHGSTIADLFMDQLQGISPSALRPLRPATISADKWGAMMAYHNYLVEEDGGNRYGVFKIGQATDIYQAINIKTRGYTDEYNISGGFNFQNKFYVGFSVGIVDFMLRNEIMYDEEYDRATNNGAEPRASALMYDQYTKFSGTGVNFKLGLIYRPVEALRLGVAVHTPTISSMRYRYDTFMRLEHYDGRWNEAELYPADMDFDFNTPTRLMAGISYMFGTHGIFTADYERTWYNGINYRSDYYRGMNNVIENEFKANHTFRVGAEVRATDIVSLRAGYSFTSSALALDTKDYTYNSAMPRESFNITAGAGFRLGTRTSLDFAYVYNRTKYSDYYVYHRWIDDKNTQYAGNIAQKINRNTILTTLSVRF